MNKKKAIIVDLDGTLCDHSHRLHFMDSKPKDWTSFFAGIPDDELNYWCLEIIDALRQRGYEIILVSGRPDSQRDNTLKWLHRFNIHFNSLFMRKQNDFREDQKVKEEIYNQHIVNFWDILFVVDDRDSVIKMWRNIGLTCLDC